MFWDLNVVLKSVCVCTHTHPKVVVKQNNSLRRSSEYLSITEPYGKSSHYVLTTELLKNKIILHCITTIHTFSARIFFIYWFHVAGKV